MGREAVARNDNAYACIWVKNGPVHIGSLMRAGLANTWLMKRRLLLNTRAELACTIPRLHGAKYERTEPMQRPGSLPMETPDQFCSMPSPYRPQTFTTHRPLTCAVPFQGVSQVARAMYEHPLSLHEFLSSHLASPAIPVHHSRNPSVILYVEIREWSASQREILLWCRRRLRRCRSNQHGWEAEVGVAVKGGANGWEGVAWC